MAHERHKRETPAPRSKNPFATLSRPVRICAPLAFLATASVVTYGVASADLGPSQLMTVSSPAVTANVSGLLKGREEVASRSSAGRAPAVDSAAAKRAAATAQARAKAARAAAAVRNATEHRWSTTDLNLWTTSGASAAQVGLLPAGRKVLVTGRSNHGRVELAIDGNSRWVTAGYLSATKPQPATGATAGLSTAPCPDGSVENGLTSGAVLLYRAVCHAFPQITTYGGWDAHGEHSSGKALDIMTSDYALGTQIAVFLQQHASELDLYDIIWWDRIWTPVRASEGWRDYGNHGSPTANHMDHVHVSVN